MQKKLTICLCLLLTLTGCRRVTPIPQPENDGHRAPTAAPSAQNGARQPELYDFLIDLDGREIALPMDYEALLALGFSAGEVTGELAPGEISRAFAMEAQGFQAEAFFMNTGMDTQPTQRCSVAGLVIEKQTEDIQVTLPKGIALGEAGRGEVESAYGAPVNVYEQDGVTELCYEYGLTKAAYLGIDQASGKLSRVELYNFEASGQEAPATQLFEHTQRALAYSAPDAMGASLTDGSFALEGELFQMPAPVYAFMEAGWILDAVESGRPDEAVVVPGQGSVQISLESGGLYLNVLACNLEEKAANLLDCFVLSISAGEKANAASLELPESVSVGMEESALLEVLSGYVYTEEDFEGIRLYTVEEEAIIVQITVAADTKAVQSIRLSTALNTKAQGKV